MKRALTAALLALAPAATLANVHSCSGPQQPAPAAGGSADRGWPQDPPRLRLRISGSMHGRLEPCGCASGQLGGLPRRIFNLKQERDYDVLVEGGNVVDGSTPIDVEKLMTALTLLSMPGTTYHALGVGRGDLAFSAQQLSQFHEWFPVGPVSSDLVAKEGTPWVAQPHVEHQGEAVHARIASLLLGPLEGPTAGRFEHLDPQSGWQRAMQGVAPTTYRVLMAHGSVDRVRALAGLVPPPDLIIGITDEVAEPPAEIGPVDRVPIVFPGTRGRMMLDVSLARLADGPRLTRYRVVRLQASETAPGALEDADAKAILLSHREQVKAAGIREQMAEQRPTVSGAGYVGNDACTDCHEEAVDAWAKTAHAHAWQTLERAEVGEKYGWPVTHYPDCVSCHVVGYGEQSGFVNPEKTPTLRDVGCESCHGPGSAHVDSGGEIDLIERGDANTCLKCHDFEQSPNFTRNYDERWAQIRH